MSRTHEVRNSLSDLTNSFEQSIMSRLRYLTDSDMERLESMLIDPINEALDQFEDFVDHRRRLGEDENE